MEKIECPTPNIYTAINDIMKELTYIQKRPNRQLGFSIVTEADIVRDLRPHLVKQGIVTHMQEIGSVETTPIPIHVKSGQEYREKTLYRTTIIGRVRFFHVESGTCIDVPSVGMAQDISDKSANKAQTALFKYAYLKTFTIETGDEPETNGKPKDSPKQEEQEEAPKQEMQKRSWSADDVKNAKAWLIEAKIAPPDIPIQEVIGRLNYSPLQAGYKREQLIFWWAKYQSYRDQGLEPGQAAYNARNDFVKAISEPTPF